MNEPLYLGQAILDLSKTLIYEFPYDYRRPKYGSKINFYRDIAKDVEKRFDTSGYLKDENKPLPIREDKKVIGLMKDELGRKIMTEFVALRAKMYAYGKIDKEVEEKGCKGTTKCVLSEGLTFDDYKTCLFGGETIVLNNL